MWEDPHELWSAHSGNGKIKGHEGHKLAFSVAWPSFLQVNSLATLVVLSILVRGPR